MGAKNKVIAGDYINYSVSPLVHLSYWFKIIAVNKETIQEYEVLDENRTKSAVSAVGRGLLGGVVLGPVGLLAGLSAKSKGIHVISIKFKDGKNSLIEIDDFIYKELIKKLY